MALTAAQLKEAIDQMKIQCDLKMNGYLPVSARSVLYELGYEADIDQLLQVIYDGGFQYCLDPQFAATHFDPTQPGGGERHGHRPPLGRRLLLGPRPAQVPTRVRSGLAADTAGTAPGESSVPCVRVPCHLGRRAHVAPLRGLGENSGDSPERPGDRPRDRGRPRRRAPRRNRWRARPTELQDGPYSR